MEGYDAGNLYPMTDVPSVGGAEVPFDGHPKPSTSSRKATHGPRSSAAWARIVVAAVALVVLLVFILQNTKSVRISFFTLNGTMPLGVALLLAAVGGVLIAGVAASLRIWQTRHRANKNKTPDAPS